MKTILAAFARNTVFANIVLLLIFLVGGIAATSMIRETFPEFSLDMITISVPYPGADPEEVEEGISRKIEEAVESIEGIKQYTTKSRENFCTAMVEVKEGFNADKVYDKVRSNIDSISTFPKDAEKPVISELTVKDPVIFLYISGDMSERRLKEWSERIKDDLQAMPSISQVDTFGARDYEISIGISEEKLREYNLSFDQVAAAVSRSNLNMSGGTIRTEGEEIRIRTMGRKYTDRELADIVVLATPGGDIITLDRLADINDGFTEDPISGRINGKRAVRIDVFKTKEEDSLQIAKDVHTYVEKQKHLLPKGATLEILYDNTQMLKKRINLLLKNGIMGLCVVFFMLWLFLDRRLSFWGGMGIPIAITGALAILWSIGGTINMVSLFGFIMVLGIVVDDAIVVGESIYVHRKMGKPPLRAAVDGVAEVGMPVVAAVLTTIVAFIPLAFVGGIMGKFIRILPMVVVACLAVSLVECLILLPAHLSHLPDPNASPARKRTIAGRIERMRQAIAGSMEWSILHIYQPFLSKALKWRYISLCIAISLMLLTQGLLMGGFIKFEVFPDIDGFVATASVEFPDGTPADVTRNAIRRIEDALMAVSDRTKTISGEPMVESRFAMVGRTLQEMPVSGPNVGSVQAFLLPSEKRGVHSKDIMVAWEKEIGAIPGVRSMVFEGLAAGPPGAPIEVWIQGYDMNKILAAANALKERLSRFDGVYQIRSDFSPGKNEIRLQLKPEARALGLTVKDLASQINSGFYGNEALRLQRGREDIRIKIRYTEDERSRAATLENVRIRTPAGYEVPLTSVADISYTPGYSTITRTDGLRRVSVSADVDSTRANANEIFAELNSSFFPHLRQNYAGLQIAMQGEQKKMRESLSSLQVGFPMAVMGIFIIIATMFRSYAQPLVILFSIPFGIIGAVVGHKMMGFDLSIMSIFGMVALTGVVVNDAIVLIERVNENLAEQMPFFKALINGGARRFRAIILTTVSTVGGLAPMIMETDLQAKFLIPMALSLAAGVAFSTLVTLMLVPNLMAILNDIRCAAFRMRHGYWPARETVEPARDRRTDRMNPTDAVHEKGSGKPETDDGAGSLAPQLSS